MLASAAPVPIRVVQRHEMSDHEFVEEQASFTKQFNVEVELSYFEAIPDSLRTEDRSK